MSDSFLTDSRLTLSRDECFERLKEVERYALEIKTVYAVEALFKRCAAHNEKAKSEEERVRFIQVKNEEMIFGGREMVLYAETSQRKSLGSSLSSWIADDTPLDPFGGGDWFDVSLPAVVWIRTLLGDDVAARYEFELLAGSSPLPQESRRAYNCCQPVRQMPRNQGSYRRIRGE